MSEEHKYSIAVVDDDKMVNEVLSLILSEHYDVKRYYSAEDVLSADNAIQFDALITDVNLPGKSGIELLEDIHAIDNNIPVIVITGLNDIDIAISALKNGAFDFILKPFKSDQILISVSKALERHRLVKENIRLMKELTEKNEELNILNKKIQARNIAIENELEIASNLQQCLFPLSFPDLPGFSFTLKYNPVEKISGDFFDFIIYDDDNFILLFADVSGHGVPAALYSSMVKTAITSLKKEMVPPSMLVESINRFLIGAQKKMSYNYSTLCCMKFDVVNRKITYCNAGIPDPVIIRSNGESVLIKANSPFVGIFDGAKYIDDTLDLCEGDKIIAFTDGAYEYNPEKDTTISKREFYERIESVKGLNTPEMIENLFGMIVEKSGSEDHFDDITLLGVSFHK